MGENNFYIITEMLKHRLGELLPNFDATGLENKLFSMCIEDFLNYLRFIWAIDLDWMKWAAEAEVPMKVQDNQVLRSKFSEWLELDPKTAREEIDMWVNLWLVKWKERVQLLFGDSELYNRSLNLLQTLERKGRYKISFEEEKDYRLPVMFTLMSRGEVVGTELLTGTVIRREAGKLKVVPKHLNEKIQFLNSCLKQVREVSSVSGKLIFVSLKGVKWRFEING